MKASLSYLVPDQPRAGLGDFCRALVGQAMPPDPLTGPAPPGMVCVGVDARPCPAGVEVVAHYEGPDT